MKRKSIHYLAECGVIAALYCVLSLILMPISFGPVQVRISEALTLLPLFTPAAIPGLTVGCMISNYIGFASGMPVRPIDILTGSLATLLAAVATRALRNVRLFPRGSRIAVIPAIPPILFNAVILGLEFTFLELQQFRAAPFWGYFASVGLGQFVSCMLLGVTLTCVLERSGLANRLFLSEPSR